MLAAGFGKGMYSVKPPVGNDWHFYGCGGN